MSEPFFKSGSLLVSIPSKKVRWIDFLAYSRIVNAKDGGWDFRRGGKFPIWVQRGLDELVNADFIRQWTENSLGDSQSPARLESFKLDRLISDERKAAAAGCDRGGIGEWSENSLNARLFQRYSTLSAVPMERPFSSRLLAYEVPLCGTREGQLKIDLLALPADGRGLEIIELKQANNTGDSPLMALVEAICYALQLWRCRESLINESRDASKRLNDSSFELNDGHFKRLHLTIAAPGQYWTYWCPEGENDAVKGKMDSILNAVSRATKPRGFTLTLGDFCRIKSEHLTTA